MACRLSLNARGGRGVIPLAGGLENRRAALRAEAAPTQEQGARECERLGVCAADQQARLKRTADILFLYLLKTIP